MSDTHAQMREMARDLIRDSVIEDAIAQRIAQIIEFIHEDRIKPLQERVEMLEERVAPHRPDPPRVGRRPTAAVFHGGSVMSEAPKRIRVWPDYNYHTTPVSADWTVGWWDTTDNPKGTEYIRADLVEAAIKRALEGAAQACEDIRQRQIMGPMPERVCFDQEQTIRALDPAQFIEEEKG